MDLQRLILSNDLKRDLPGCDELWVGVALATDSGFQFIQKYVNDQAAQHWVVGVDLATVPSVLRRFMEDSVGLLAGRYYYRRGKTFHPKVYVLRTGQKYVAYVGSGNCTLGGLEVNVELAVRIEDQQLCEKLVQTIEAWFKHGSTVDEEFLSTYEKLFARRNERRAEDSADTEELLGDEVSGGMDLSRIDFTEQFFKREHFEAFAGRKPWMETKAVNDERKAVRNRLYQLNDLLTPKLASKGWDLHEHYMREDVVSSAVHGERTSKRLDGIWLHYGRSRASLKRYGLESTPLDFMRLQVIVLATSVGIWLRISKDNGSLYDRQHIRERLMNDPAWVDRLFALIAALPAHYYIMLNNGSKYVNEFATAEELQSYLLEADHKYYFIQGMEMQPGDPRLSVAHIEDTVITEFGVLYPIYDMLLHRLPVPQ